jgi:hypothetical protein
MRVAVLTVAILIISQVAYAEPVHLSCDGRTLTAIGKVLENHTRSLTFDLAAGTVSFNGSGSLSILPAAGMDGPDRVQFIAVPQPAIRASTGSLNRITGEVSVKFKDGEFYHGVCKPARRLF